MTKQESEVLREVIFCATISAMPYAAYDAETKKLVGYADRQEDTDGIGLLTLDRDARNLDKPIKVKVVSRDERLWED